MQKLTLLGATLALLPALTFANPDTLDHPGRTLAANCFQCHGTNGYGMEHLAGQRVSRFLEKMDELQYSDLGKNIMNIHAQTYSEAEIKLIAEYFSLQQ